MRWNAGLNRLGSSRSRCFAMRRNCSTGCRAKKISSEWPKRLNSLKTCVKIYNKQPKRWRIMKFPALQPRGLGLKGNWKNFAMNFRTNPRGNSLNKCESYGKKLKRSNASRKILRSRWQSLTCPKPNRMHGHCGRRNRSNLIWIAN